MMKLLARLFIKNSGDTADPAVRMAYGRLCGIVGIALNLLLFSLKYFAGVVSGSIAITADAFNNLSDAGSSVITLAGFALAGKKPDPHHPFGHGRLEYIAGLAVSAVIVVMGAELLRSSVARIFSPEPVQAGLLPAVILLVSIAVKLYMAVYNRAIGKMIDSPAIAAASTDSLSDSAATAVVLACMLIARFTGLDIDAYAGVAVAGFILYAGIGAARDTISPLLGQAPSREFVKQIEAIVLKNPEILGMHDLIVHDYGPGRVMISLHAEVDGHGDMFEKHDAIDNIERELAEKLGCHAVVHMDPIDMGSEDTARLRAEVAEIVREVEPASSIHDFRTVPGPTHTNLIFDAVVPCGEKRTDEEVAALIRSLVAERLPGNYAVVNIDRAYTEL
jgi:cation diffusion facilitator family transporter